MALSNMAFKLTYTDGQEAEYDDDTAWEVDDGVLKMGRKEGDWTVLVSPSHWAVIEAGSAASRADRDKDKKDKDKKDEDKKAEDSDDDSAAEEKAAKDTSDDEKDDD